jgi:hypothetical protein
MKAPDARPHIQEAATVRVTHDPCRGCGRNRVGVLYAPAMLCWWCLQARTHL